MLLKRVQRFSLPDSVKRNYIIWIGIVYTIPSYRAEFYGASPEDESEFERRNHNRSKSRLTAVGGSVSTVTQPVNPVRVVTFPVGKLIIGFIE